MRFNKKNSSQSLLYYLKYAFYLWNKNKNRYSWLFCPICSHDLNGDNESFIRESKDRMYWYFKCANCGCKSKWHLYGPVPLPDSHQKLTNKLLECKEIISS